MSDFVAKALFFMILSALFPMIGFYLDWRSKNKKRRSSASDQTPHPKK